MAIVVEAGVSEREFRSVDGRAIWSLLLPFDEVPWLGYCCSRSRAALGVLVRVPACWMICGLSTATECLVGPNPCGAAF